MRVAHHRVGNLLRSLLAFVALLASGMAAGAIEAVRVVGGLAAPLEIVHAGDGSGRLFIVEQAGTVRVLTAGRLLAQPFLDLRQLVVAGGERGLLGLAFHPSYATNGRLFVNYTREADGATVIAAYRVGSDANAVDPASGRILLTIAQPFANHNGGTLRFGPDGKLYIGMGDGGAANDPGNRAQDPQSLLGKLLRIDVDGAEPYAVPADNPYAQGGGLPEIFALGLRNPWKWSFDRGTGALLIGDVGQGAREEVDYVAPGQGAGLNFGWRVLEGTRCTELTPAANCSVPRYAPPVLDYGHELGCSITGGYVYRGTQVPELAGRYVYGDYCSGRMWTAPVAGAAPWTATQLLVTGGGLSTFGEDEAGELYFADQNAGEIYRLADTTPAGPLVVEYYHGALDHYFMTALPTEIAELDAGAFSGWQRTGRGFHALPSGAPNAHPVCRFYLPPADGDSHFYSASAAECATVAARFPSFVLETPSAMEAGLPDALSGACSAGTIPVYRLWNGRRDNAHRYTTDHALRDAMIASGYLAEGYGDGVGMCALP